MKKSLVPIALAFALIAVAPAAFGNASGTLTLNSSVAANCTISNATLNFGPYDPVVTNAATPLDGSTTMTVACTKGFIPTIGIPAAGRTITHGADTLTYELYTDSPGGTVWGEGAALFTPPSAPGKGGTAYTIYGRIPGGLDVGVGAYTGTILVTVNF
jgi:spore coat protein U-like protein